MLINIRCQHHLVMTLYFPNTPVHLSVFSKGSASMKFPPLDAAKGPNCKPNGGPGNAGAQGYKKCGDDKLKALTVVHRLEISPVYIYMDNTYLNPPNILSLQLLPSPFYCFNLIYSPPTIYSHFHLNFHSQLNSNPQPPADMCLSVLPLDSREPAKQVFDNC